MGGLYGAIAFFLCLTGFVLTRNKTCLSYNEATKKCECCYSGLTGQDCKRECPNCGSRYVNNRCERFCQNASFYGTLCDIQCPTHCFHNGGCDESCATHLDSRKDIHGKQEPCPSRCFHEGVCDKNCDNSGASRSHPTWPDAPSLGSVSLARVEAALITMAMCAVLYVAHIFGVKEVCRKWLKALKDKCKCDKRPSAERMPLNSQTVQGEVSDSTTQTEVDGAPSSPADFLHSDSTKNNKDSSRLVPEQPQRVESRCYQISEPVAESEQDFDVHTASARQLGSYHGTAAAISNID